MTSSSVDDAYEEYLWGEASPRAFARKAKLARPGAPVRSRPRVEDLLRT